jgi:hypothetical protein
MGSDNLEQFSRWRRWQEIARRIPIAVVRRPGTVLASCMPDWPGAWVLHRGSAPAVSVCWMGRAVPRARPSSGTDPWCHGRSHAKSVP